MALLHRHQLAHEPVVLAVGDRRGVGDVVGELVPDQVVGELAVATPDVGRHRLLVRGHRIETAAQTRTVRVPADAVQIDPTVVAPVVAAPMLVLLFLIALIPSGKKKPRSR